MRNILSSSLSMAALRWTLLGLRRAALTLSSLDGEGGIVWATSSETDGGMTEDKKEEAEEAREDQWGGERLVIKPAGSMRAAVAADHGCAPKADMNAQAERKEDAMQVLPR